MQQAHQHGMSFGKYKAVQELQAQGYAITLEECRSISMAEIRSLTQAPGSGEGRKHRHRQELRCDDEE